MVTCQANHVHANEAKSASAPACFSMRGRLTDEAEGKKYILVIWINIC